MDIVLIQRKGIKLNTNNTVKPIWLACIFEKMPPLEEIWPLYRLRFNIDHWNRFAKQRLHWTKRVARSIATQTPTVSIFTGVGTF